MDLVAREAQLFRVNLVFPAKLVEFRNPTISDRWRNLRRYRCIQEYLLHPSVQEARQVRGVQGDRVHQATLGHLDYPLGRYRHSLPQIPSFLELLWVLQDRLDQEDRDDRVRQ